MTTVRHLLTQPAIRAAIIFALLLTWCSSLLCFRTLWTWNMDYAFLIWNLGLATMPLIFSAVFVQLQHRFARVIALPLWLLFLPNAPYILTDFIHLRHLTSAPIWLDILLLFSCSITGLVFACYSVAQIH